MKNTIGIRGSTVPGASIIPCIAGPLTLAARRHCRGCGSHVPLGLKFCTTCGQPVSAHPR